MMVMSMEILASSALPKILQIKGITNKKMKTREMTRKNQMIT